MLKALVISDDKGRFRDVGDILAVARAQGQKLFKTHQNVQVIEIFTSPRGYYVAIVSFEVGYPSSTGASGTRKRTLDQ